MSLAVVINKAKINNLIIKQAHPGDNWLTFKVKRIFAKAGKFIYIIKKRKRNHIVIISREICNRVTCIFVLFVMGKTYQNANKNTLTKITLTLTT